MSDDLAKLVVPALIGLAAWLVKDVAFRFVQQIRDIERTEWEYRLKEIYCPLYFWSGLLALRTEKAFAHEICVRVQEIMARAAYVIPRAYYFTIVKLLESAYDQATLPATATERDAMRLYLYNQIEALNMLLYRSEYLGGAGDPNAALSPQRRWLRLLLIAMGHFITWFLAVVTIAALVWLYQRGPIEIIGLIAVVFLVLLFLYVRRRGEVRKGLEQRIKGKP